jgi:hypothetical protein
VDGKANKNQERAAGIGGVVLVAPWVFLGVLRIIDLISRAQTAMSIVPYLGVFADPIAFMIEFIGVAGLLFYATRLEHVREAEDTPRIIRAWSDPEQPKRHWFWIKLAIGVASVTVVVAVGLSMWFRFHKAHSVGTSTSSPVNAGPSAASTSQTTNPVPSKAATNTDKGRTKPAGPSQQVNTTVSQQPASIPQSQGSTALQSQLDRLVETNKTLTKGDRDRLTDAFFEFSQLLDKANTIWAKANYLKVDERGPILKDLQARKGKIPGIEAAAKAFEKSFYESRQKWKYYEDQITVIFGEDPDNHALIVRNATDEYAGQLDSVLALKDANEATLKALLRPEDIRYDDAIHRFALWKSECEHRLERIKASIQ